MPDWLFQEFDETANIWSVDFRKRVRPLVERSTEAFDKGLERRPSVEWFQWLGAVLLIALALVFTFRDGVLFMTFQWSAAEYSHGYLIPLIAFLLVWQKSRDLSKTEFSGAWSGAFIVFAGVAIFLVGELGTVYTVIQYAFLLTLWGFVLAAFGWKGLRSLWMPLVYLFFMVPLPRFLYVQLSSEMQLIASEWGVAVIRLLGISVFLDGNIIDLGTYKLQVVEACDGLRYLFPLMSFGFLVAYLYQGPFWHRAVVFLSTIPITIVMNIFRIGVIGVLVEHYGIEVAVGFLHDFQGWAIFMVCVAMLFAEIWLLNRVTLRKVPFRELFNLSLPKISLKSMGAHWRQPPRSLMAATAFLLIALVGSMVLTQRAEIIPQREPFISFPMQFGEWRGQRAVVEKSIIYALGVDDWIMANYFRPEDPAHVNFYVAYYSSQRKGGSVHSPQGCIPGGGWRIDEFYETTLSGVGPGGQGLTVNRAVIRKGQTRQLVYYWFQQRDRWLTNEYVVKWYLFWDAVTRNRTDGALIRVITPFGKGEGEAEADQRVTDFIREAYSRLEAHLPAT